MRRKPFMAFAADAEVERRLIETSRTEQEQ